MATSLPVPPDADAVARAFALGGGASEMTFAARGELGRVFRLETDGGVWAVKELFTSLALAVQGHLLDFYARRWLANDAGSDDRARSEWRLRAMTARPLTRGSIDRLVRSLRS